MDILTRNALREEAMEKEMALLIQQIQEKEEKVRELNEVLQRRLSEIKVTIDLTNHFTRDVSHIQLNTVCCVFSFRLMLSSC